MENSTFVSLLEKKKEDIIQAIKQTVIESFTPDFYGVYEIYLNEGGGQILHHKVDQGEALCQLEAPMRYLHSIPSHAISSKTYQEWLMGSGLLAPEGCSGKERKNHYKPMHHMYMDLIRINAMESIVYADEVYDIILNLYKTKKDITYEDILESYYGEGA